MRPDPKDVALCVAAVLGRYASVAAYQAAVRVVTVVRTGCYPNGLGTLRDMQLTQTEMDAWLDGSDEANCAQALEIYKQHYPEG